MTNIDYVGIFRSFVFREEVNLDEKTKSAIKQIQGILGNYSWNSIDANECRLTSPFSFKKETKPFKVKDVRLTAEGDCCYPAVPDSKIPKSAHAYGLGENHKSQIAKPCPEKYS